MPITVISGRPGAGKSMKLADKLVEILQRNIRWFDRTGIMRPVYSNLQINSKLETKFQEKIYKIAESWEKVLGEKIQVTPLLNYWVDIRDLIKTIFL
jgi:tRNA uridine 5-carbamoylmethylation protein Kti12